MLDLSPFIKAITSRERAKARSAEFPDGKELRDACIQRLQPTYGRCGRDVAARDGKTHPSGTPPVFLFHNDIRVKTESADGRISSTLAPDGWDLVLL